MSLEIGARFLERDGWYHAASAVIVGEVTIGAGANVWYGTVIRGDDAPIRIGQNVNLQDFTMVHADPGVPLEVEDDVTVGHRAILHCRRIGRNSLVGMGSVLLHDVVVGEGSIIGAGAVVAPGVEIPPRSLVRGVPGRVVRETTEAEREAIQDSVRKYAENARDFFRRYGESDG